jgi:RecJ-like exonuclease
MGSIYALRAHGDIDDRIVGVVASILLSTGMLKNEKPLVAWARAEEGLMKVSARATEPMAARGLDLGEVMKKASESFNGRGGGHDIAAGAFLPEDGERAFIELVDILVGEQYNA